MLFLYLFISLFVLTIAKPPCEYNSGKKILTCNFLQPETDPGNLITNETFVLLLNNTEELRITKDFHRNPSYAHLTSYKILSSRLQEFESFTFQPVKNLRYLEIKWNELKALKNYSFFGLTYLEQLYMEGNGIVDLEEKAFAGLKNLITLELTKNDFKKVANGIFEDLENLSSLFLSKNGIEEIEIEAFKGLNKLELLDLSENKLKVLNGVTFSGLKNLWTLYCGKNEIDEIEGEFKCENLKFFYVQNNRIRSISNNIFNGSPKLIQIDLSSNQIEELTEKPFLELHNLIHLSVRNNLIKDVSNLKSNLNKNVLLTY